MRSILLPKSGIFAELPVVLTTPNISLNFDKEFIAKKFIGCASLTLFLMKYPRNSLNCNEFAVCGFSAGGIDSFCSIGGVIAGGAGIVLHPAIKVRKIKKTAILLIIPLLLSILLLCNYSKFQLKIAQL
jgi:hypothetical protein